MSKHDETLDKIIFILALLDEVKEKTKVCPVCDTCKELHKLKDEVITLSAVVCLEQEQQVADLKKELKEFRQTEEMIPKSLTSIDKKSMN